MTSNCPYCSEKFEESESRKDLSGRKICEKCYNNYLNVLRGFARIGGRALV